MSIRNKKGIFSLDSITLNVFEMKFLVECEII